MADPYKIATSQYIVQSVSETASGVSGNLRLLDGTGGPYGKDIQNLKFNITYVSDSILRVKITDLEGKRWQAEQYVLKKEVLSRRISAKQSKKYAIEVAQTGQSFYFTINRVGSSIPVFTTKGLPFVFSDQYISIGTTLFSTQTGDAPNIYGFGERIDRMSLNITNNEYVMWNNDNGNQEKMNLYGSHPFYLQAGTYSNAHGAFLLNTNAMSVRIEFNNNAKYIQYQTIGGILDFYFFLGPTAEQVIQQYHSIIGKPYLPPLWSMGFHQCRWGYRTLDEVQKVVAGYDANQLPLEVMWTDIDYMYKYWDFTFDPDRYPINDVRQFVTNELHNKGRKYVVIVDPGIPILDLNKETYEPLELGLSLDIFVKGANSSNYVNHVVWPGNCYFPDMTHPKFKNQYWKPVIHGFLSTINLDGLWTDMNEPATLDFFVPAQNSLNFPPFVPGGDNEPLYHKSIDLDSQMSASTHYNAHNLYGFLESIATAEALQSYYGKRSFVLSRSSYAGSGAYVSHWTGDNDSTFESLRSSIPSIILNGMFGFAHVGSDIGGFNQNTTKELLIRWMQVGSMYPFSRNHNAIGNRPQEPFAFDQETTDISRKFITNRYRLLPYLYTTMAQVSMNGGLAARPLFFSFPNEKSTYTIEEQFMYGEALLVSPALYYSQTVVTAYFPKAVWYDFFNGKLQTNTGGVTIQLPADLHTMPISIKGGSIVPTQTPGMNTVQQLLNPYQLIVALDANQTASGMLYLDDGETLDTLEDQLYTTIQYSVSSNSKTYSFKGIPTNLGYNNAKQLILDQVIMYGLNNGNSVNSVIVNGAAINTFTFDYSDRVLKIVGLNLSITSILNVQIIMT
ncbi:predicted protein [Naegleria gruberi]|uniref:Maltase n=1 Tax=Naegleria gruberi TaxID=5762 RepID=D2VBH5_NAEGR|nr:uncharacterized protein NAEGRDRAFT_32656 [Naegleria gruberi]EFC45907.1 predicted protein [Naegleria gruberi]|eukprot:XP_002678651.1 predicted protein [Naegleria gruberi strain NEG-M]